jgi:hypothetical protein
MARRKTQNALPRITEKEFEQQFVQLAAMLSYKLYHTANSMKSQKGFPDWVAASETRKRTVFVELKVWPNKPTPEQLEWNRVLRAAGQLAFIWFPEDLDEMRRVLSGDDIGPQK